MSLTVCLQTALQLGSGHVHEFHQLLTACLREDLPAGEAAQQACYVFLLLSHVKSPKQQVNYRQAVCLAPALQSCPTLAPDYFMSLCMWFVVTVCV